MIGELVPCDSAQPVTIWTPSNRDRRSIAATNVSLSQLLGKGDIARTPAQEVRVDAREGPTTPRLERAVVRERRLGSLVAGAGPFGRSSASVGRHSLGPLGPAVGRSSRPDHSAGAREFEPMIRPMSRDS